MNDTPIDWPALAQCSCLLAAFPCVARRSARLMRVSPGARLFACGDQPKAMHFVVDGEVHLTRTSPGGAELILQRARDGVVAEASLDQSAYHCDAMAISPTVLIRIPQRVFREALDDVTFRTEWIAHLSRELRRVRAQAERMHLKTAEDRVAHFLMIEGTDGTLKLERSRKQWAGELGLTHEALYRALSRMQRSGQIIIEADTITLRGTAKDARS